MGPKTGVNLGESHVTVTSVLFVKQNKTSVLTAVSLAPSFLPDFDAVFALFF